MTDTDARLRELALAESISRCQRIVDIIDDGLDKDEPLLWRPTIRAHANVTVQDLEWLTKEIAALLDAKAATEKRADEAEPPK